MLKQSRRNRPYGANGPSGQSARTSAVHFGSGSAKNLGDARRGDSGRPPSAIIITRAVNSSSSIWSTLITTSTDELWLMVRNQNAHNVKFEMRDVLSGGSKWPQMQKNFYYIKVYGSRQIFTRSKDGCTFWLGRISKNRPFSFKKTNHL